MYRRPLILIVLLIAAAGWGGCRMVTPVVSSPSIEPFATVQPLDGGAVFLEVDPLAHHANGAVVRVNDRPWDTEAVVRRGDRIEIGYREAPHAGRLSYRTIGRSPRGQIHFEVSRWFDDGFPARTRRVAVWPYRDGAQTARSR